MLGDGNLLSPERRRGAVVVLQQRCQASERLACLVVGQGWFRVIRRLLA